MIASLLANEDITQGERIHRSGLPRRTYEVGRRRLLESGTLIERYVPTLSTLGIETVSFAIAHPYAERFSDASHRWLQSEGCVLLWRTHGLLFGVFLNAPGTAQPGPESRILPRSDYSRTFLLKTAADDESIPVYFDFEGEWASVTGTSPVSYPQPIGPGSGRASPPNGRRMRVLEEAVAGSSGDLDGVSGSSFFSALGRSGAIRRLSVQGHLRRRAFLNPASLPGYQGWTLGELIFVNGRLLPGRSARALLTALLEGSRVTPFLFASDGESVLIGGMSPAPPSREPEQSITRLSVMGTLQSYLASIETHREAVSGLEVLNNHQYGRAFSDYRG